MSKHNKIASNESWETIVDFTNINKEGVHIDEVLLRLFLASNV